MWGVGGCHTRPVGFTASMGHHNFPGRARPREAIQPSGAGQYEGARPELPGGPHGGLGVEDTSRGGVRARSRMGFSSVFPRVPFPGHVQQKYTRPRPVAVTRHNVRRGGSTQKTGRDSVERASV